MRILLRIFALVALRECTTISAFLAQPQRAFVQKTAKEWAGVTALATLLAANPLVVPQTARAVEAPVTALVINVDVSDPKAIAKSAFGHRSELATAAKDFLQAAKTLGTDLEGIVPPNSASASIRLPTDLKASARDAASGRARVMVNGSPMYVEIGSEQGLLSMRILVSSPFLPKIPFMAATEEALKIPVTFHMGKSEAVSAAPPAKSDGLFGFLDLTFTVPGTAFKFSVLQAAEGVLLAIPTTYVLSYAFYVWEKEEAAKQAAAKKTK